MTATLPVTSAHAVGTATALRTRSTAEQFRFDAVLGAALGAAASLMTFHHAERLSPLLFDTRFIDLWFDADTAVYVDLMIARQGEHGATNVHPLLSLMLYPPVKLLRAALSLPTLQAIRAMLALVAALWAGAMFAVLRLMGCRRADAVVFALLALVSAAAMCWLAVPESGAMGSLSILSAVGVLALSQRRPVSPFWYALTSAFTLGTTVTNWLAGIAISALAFPRRRALQITIAAFCLVVILAAVQKAIFPTAHWFPGNPEKARFLLHPRAGGPETILKSFMFHTMAMPAIVNAPEKPPQPQLITQRSAPGSGSMWGRLAVWLWAALLGIGLWAAARGRRAKTVQGVGLILLGQLSLHLVFGMETFLHALHFLPLLILLAAFGARTRARPLVLVLGAALIACAFINNARIFEQAAAEIARFEQSL
jgi:hypothetical protein